MKITAIDPFSVKEERVKPTGPRDRPRVAAVSEAHLDPVKPEPDNGRLFNIIEEAQKRAKRKQRFSDQRRQKVLGTYTLVLNGFTALHARGKKFDTRI